MTIRARVFNLAHEDELDVLAPTREDAVLYMAKTFPNGTGIGRAKPTTPGFGERFATSVSEEQAVELRADESLKIERGEVTILCGDWTTFNEEESRRREAKKGRRR